MEKEYTLQEQRQDLHRSDPFGNEHADECRLLWSYNKLYWSAVRHKRYLLIGQSNSTIKRWRKIKMEKWIKIFLLEEWNSRRESPRSWWDEPYGQSSIILLVKRRYTFGFNSTKDNGISKDKNCCWNSWGMHWHRSDTFSL